MNTSDLYIIRCLTNLHAGAGDDNYGAIDKRVQRDSASNMPCIFSSSLKGSIREYFETLSWQPTIVEGKVNAVTTHEQAKAVFGSSVREDSTKASPGKFRFLQAHLLSLPIRSNMRPFYSATCPTIAKEFLEMAELAGHKWSDLAKSMLGKLANPQEVFGTTFVNPGIFEAGEGQTFLEDLEAKRIPDAFFSKEEKALAQTMFGDNIALVPDEAFQNLHDNLPVIARNQLENGESKNLWYEEVVPRQARFWVSIIRPVDFDHQEFSRILTEQTIQIGANASIGYGLTKFYSL